MTSSMHIFDTRANQINQSKEKAIQSPPISEQQALKKRLTKLESFEHEDFVTCRRIIKKYLSNSQKTPRWSKPPYIPLR